MENETPDDPLAMYVREARKVEPLTKDEETKLFRELGDSGEWDQQQENVARRLIESQLISVVSIAQRHSGAGVSTLDLVQEGNIGLMDAVRSFAARPIGDFPAHAAACIEERIAKALGKSK